MTIALEVTTTDLMGLFDCSRSTITNLQRIGVLTPTRRGHYDLRQASRAYSQHHRKVASQHYPTDLKEAVLASLVRLRDAQTARVEALRHREEVAVIERSEHHRLVALTAFSFRAAMQDASDIIGRRLGLDKTSWDFVAQTIDARLVHYTGIAANRMGLPEQELGILLGQIRENYLTPDGGWLHPRDYPDPPPDPLYPRPDSTPANVAKESIE